MSIFEEIYKALCQGVQVGQYSKDLRELENISLSPAVYNEIRADQNFMEYLSFQPKPMFMNILPIIINHKQTERFLLNSKAIQREWCIHCNRALTPELYGDTVVYHHDRINHFEGVKTNDDSTVD